MLSINGDPGGSDDQRSLAGGSEKTLLLPGRAVPSATTATLFRSEMNQWSALSAAAMLGLFMQSLPEIVLLTFVGHISTTQLAAVTTSQIWAMGLGWILWVAQYITQCSLVSRASGAVNEAASGASATCHRNSAVNGWSWISAAVGLGACIPIGICWVFLDRLLSLMGVESSGNTLDLEMVRRYTWACLPGLFFMTIAEALSARLVSLQVNLPLVLVDTVVAGFEVVVGWLLITGASGHCRTLRLEYMGCAVAFVLSTALAVVGYLAVTLVYTSQSSSPGGRTQSTPSVEDSPTRPQIDDEAALLTRSPAAVGSSGDECLLAFLRRRSNWLVFTRMFLANLLTLLLEIGQSIFLAMLVVISHPTSAAAIAAQNIVTEIFEFFSNVLYGFAEATSVRVGFHLGALSQDGAKRAIKASILASLVSALVMGLAMAMCLAPVIGAVFTSDSGVVQHASTLSSCAGALYVIYAMYISVSSVLDGQGRASVNPLISFTGAWAVTGTLAIVVSKVYYSQFGIAGFWVARILGTTVSFGMASAAVYRSPWSQLMALAD